MKFAILIVFSYINYVSSRNGTSQLNENRFPDNFLFGIGTSAHQIEGGWNLSGKGESTWDRLTHEHPEAILDNSNADVTCDSYHKYKEDVALLKNLGVQVYRFSIAWTRIFPNGLSNPINADGIRYYNDLIDLLVENNIQPMVTILHVDIPDALDKLGGFSNELMIDWFEQYTKAIFEHFGDRVKFWITFNNPYFLCVFDDGRVDVPAKRRLTGFFDYICIKNVLKSHARVYHLYNQKFRSSQKGKIGLVLDSIWFKPGSNSSSDIEAAQRSMDFKYGFFTDPIFSEKGGYPETVKEFIGARSKEEGFEKSRLPELSEDEIKYIHGTCDFLGVNHYSTELIDDVEPAPIGEPTFQKDIRIRFYYDDSWPVGALDSNRIVPWGFRKILNYIRNRYGDIEIIITENGFSDYGGLNDTVRIDYFKKYLSVLLDVIYEDKIRVTAYCAWSLMDNFEWLNGYVIKFGLHHVDFNDPERPRTPKLSAHFYKQLLSERRIPKDFPIN